MNAPASPRPPRPIAASEHWRANPFHRIRLGEVPAPDRIERWGRDPRTGNVDRGRDILSGRWRIGAEHIRGEFVSPWALTHPSRHFTARLHSFNWLIDLAALGPLADVRIAALVDEWVGAFGEWDEIAWDPELTAERVYALLCWGRPAFERGAPELRPALLRSLARQARLLMLAHGELSERHLGSIKAGAALILAGAAGLGDPARLAEQGEEMLIEACAKQFFPDGGHMSRSPEALAKAIFDITTAQDALAEPQRILGETLPKLANMLRMLRLGDGGLACFHGGSESSAASIDAALERCGGEVRNFQFGNHTGFQRLEGGALRVLFDVGGAPPLSYAERAHASALAFEMSSERERLIVNIGAGRELAPDARQAARATNAHSTLSLGDALSAALEDRRGKGSPRLVGPTLDDVRRSADDAGITVQGRHDGYRAAFGLMHRRYLFIDHEGRNLRGIDELIRPQKHKGPTPKGEIPYMIRFHLHPSVRAQLIEHQMALLETPGGQAWRLRTDAPLINIEPSTYWGGHFPRDTCQITLSGGADPLGHGLAPPNRIRWALARSA
ncbi:MAG: heparinase II/III family protein [Hyphomonadaceae bacterium]|nr:heparinase II/III family protein [Hyphomonadaceae bacterium]